MSYYGEINNVITRSGIDANELYLPDEGEEVKNQQEKFEDFVEKLLIRAKSYIDLTTNNNFLESTAIVKRLADDIAERIAVRMLSLITRDQTNQVIEVGQFNIQLIEDVVLTDNIRKDLKILPRGSEYTERGNIGIAIVGGDDEDA